MPFNQDVKSSMFLRCNRRCCLCHKICGTNIEAAHIVDEAAGGSNDEDNGIALCLDCHQEVGAYNDKHPRGNKFRPAELRARRDQVYKWVAEGKFVKIALQSKSTPSIPNPIHRIIDLLGMYHDTLGKIHQSNTNETRLAALEEWSSCHPMVWEDKRVRNNNIRNLADPAKEWLSNAKCPYT